MRLVARFEVRSGGEVDLPEDARNWVTALRWDKSFVEGVTGRATTLFWHSGPAGARSYVAVERIEGCLDDGRAGTLIVHHAGTESDVETHYGIVVDGGGDFAGWTGRARLRHDERGAYFEFDLVEPG